MTLESSRCSETAMQSMHFAVWLKVVVNLLERIMKNRLVLAALVAVTASIAVPVFASGYGPAPFYRPEVGAPASQRGQSAQTIAAERANASAQGNNEYGGVIGAASQSGPKHVEQSGEPAFANH
ncbi:hypothetical protein SAMN05414139_05356 [Burkholderia sp. D7]|nr:hypothetical protein SAMN05414139_05356 [Burkholderia sp. D7]